MVMKLFQPGKIGNVMVKNRIVMAPMGIGALVEHDGRLTQRAIEYFVARAIGGVGMIITGSGRVTRRIEYSTKVPRHLAVDDTRYIPGLKALAESAHRYGAKVAVQVRAGVGRVLYRTLLSELEPVAPSAVPCFWDRRINARELTKEEIEALTKDFEMSARFLKEAGIDAIEIESHSGYLMDQFLTRLWNKRNDEYGGSLAGRIRHTIQVIDAIKKGSDEKLPVIFRFGLSHFLKNGRGIDEGLEIARRLERAGVDAFHIDAGCYETHYWVHPPTTQPPGCTVALANMVKDVVKVPVIAVGKLGYPDLAEKILIEGKADFIALGRPLLADPEWANKVKEFDDIRPCIGCHEGCLRNLFEHKPVGCAVNPITGNETEVSIKRAEKTKSILIIGGGPSGMEGAMIAKKRGHKVTLWEKNRSLGGNLIPASVPDFKRDYARLLNYYITQLYKLGVSIELGKEATPELISDFNPDFVIIATGAVPVLPQVTIAQSLDKITAMDVLMGTKEISGRVVIVGGGLIGCETALYLAQKGGDVQIVEVLDTVASNMQMVNRRHLLKLLTNLKVDITTGVKIYEIAENGLIVVDSYNELKSIIADTIIFASGLESNVKLVESLRDRASVNFYCAGDCVEPRNVMHAISDGFSVACSV
jgi:2-enoate reductase